MPKNEDLTKLPFDELMRRGAEEMQRMGGTMVTVALPLGRLCVILSMMQLAMRHPSVKAESRDNAEEDFRTLLRFVGEHVPAAAEFVRRGLEGEIPNKRGWEG
jgi:hypothetical protein